MYEGWTLCDSTWIRLTNLGPQGPLGNSLLVLPRRCAILVPKLDTSERFLIKRLLSVQLFVGTGIFTTIAKQVVLPSFICTEENGG